MIQSEEGNQYNLMVTKFLEFVSMHELEIAGTQWLSLLDMVRFAGPDVIPEDMLKKWSRNYEEITEETSITLSNMK